MKKHSFWVCFLLVLPLVSHAQLLRKKKTDASSSDSTTTLRPLTHTDSLMWTVLLELDSVVAAGVLPAGWRAWSGACPHPYGYSADFGWPYLYQLQWLCPEQNQAKKHWRSEFQVISRSTDRAPYTVVIWLYPDQSGRSARMTVGGPGDWSSYYFEHCCWDGVLDLNAVQALQSLVEFLNSAK